MMEEMMNIEGAGNDKIEGEERRRGRGGGFLARSPLPVPN
jgi:hypothetical protein